MRLITDQERQRWRDATPAVRLRAAMETIARSHGLCDGPLGLAGGFMAVLASDALRHEAIEALKQAESYMEEWDRTHPR